MNNNIVDEILALKKTKNPLWLRYNIKYGESLADHMFGVLHLASTFDIQIEHQNIIHIITKEKSQQDTSDIVFQLHALETVLQAIAYEEQYDLDLSDVIYEYETYIQDNRLLPFCSEQIMKR
ncbi:MAG: hypothetical protein ACMXYA_01120 [Candidatus Woesearchaeota archaeon]